MNKIEIIDNNYNKNIFFVKGEFDLKGRFTGRIYKAEQGIFDTLNYINKYEVYKSVLYNHIEYDKINSKYLKIYKMDLENIKKITQSNTFYINENLSQKEDDLNTVLFTYYNFISKKIKSPILNSNNYEEGRVEDWLNWYYFERIRTLIY